MKHYKQKHEPATGPLCPTCKHPHAKGTQCKHTKLEKLDVNVGSLGSVIFSIPDCDCEVGA